MWAFAGPVNIHEQVLRAMDRPSQNHRDPWFPPFFSQILEDTKYIFKAKNATPFVFPGTGTGGWEVALTNTLSPGDKIVTFRYGQFSHLWIDMMQRLGLDVRLRCVLSVFYPACTVGILGYILMYSPFQLGSPLQASMTTGDNVQSMTHGMLRQVQVVEVPWGGGADEAKLEEILKADTDKKIKAVAVVHNETTTGVTSDIGQVRQVC
jgi:aspartate aminotransferase-like enzyme